VIPNARIFAPLSAKVWLGANLAGAAMFFWDSHQLWVTRDEGGTFGDGASLFFLMVIFGFANIAMLLFKGVIAVKSRSWRLLVGPTIALAIWGAVIAYLFVRIRIFASTL
jgi:hypothetical protein